MNEIKLTQEQLDEQRESCTMTNTAFIMHEAVRLITEETEKRMKAKGYGYTQRARQLSTRLNNAMRDLRVANDALFDFVCEELMPIGKSDAFRADANDLARLVLLIADRTARNYSIFNYIENYLRSCPEQGEVSTETINKFKLK